MPKISIDKDEWYPVLTIYAEGSGEIEVSDAFVKKVKKVFRDFNQIQEELETLANR